MRMLLLLSLSLIILQPETVVAQKKGETLLVVTKDADISVEGKVLKTLHEGYEVVFKDISAPWYWVEHKGTLGWINSTTARTIPEAIEFYTSQINANPSSSNYRYRGDAYLLQKKYQSALNDLDEAVRLDSGSAKNFDSRASIHSKLGNRKQMYADINMAIQLDPTSATRYNNRGVLYASDSKPDKAIADYTQSIRLNPKKAIYFKNRGMSYKKKDDFKSAIKDFDSAVKLLPAYSSAIAERGDCQLELKNYEAALQDYQAALKIDPASTDALWGMALYFDIKKDPQQANQYYENVLKLDPKRYFAYYKIGSNFQSENNFAKAIQNYDRSIAIKPTYRSAHRNRGICYRKTGNYAQALKDFDQAIQISPKHPDAYRSRAWLKITASDPKFIDLAGAKQDLAQAEKFTSPGSWRLAQSFAGLYAAEGKFDQAVETMNKAIALQQEHTTLSEAARQQARDYLALYQQKKPYREIPLKP